MCVFASIHTRYHLLHIDVFILPYIVYYQKQKEKLRRMRDRELFLISITQENGSNVLEEEEEEN